jgi:hypothetical protein
VLNTNDIARSISAALKAVLNGAPKIMKIETSAASTVPKPPGSNGNRPTIHGTVAANISMLIDGV